MTPHVTLDVLLNLADKRIEPQDLTNQESHNLQESLEYHAKRVGYTVQRNKDYMTRQNGDNVDALIDNDGLIRYVQVPEDDLQFFLEYEIGAKWGVSPGSRDCNYWSISTTWLFLDWCLVELCRK